jgi:ATP-dependent DNA ligase
MKSAMHPPLAPVEAMSVDTIPLGANWQYEPKWNGFRCMSIYELFDFTSVPFLTRSRAYSVREGGIARRIERHMKIIVLDIDGVLNCKKTPNPRHFP